MSAQSLNNVVGLGVNTINNMVERMLNEYARRSVKTAQNYRNHYKEFFKFVVGKDIEDVSWNDLKNIRYNKVQDYREYIFDKSFKKYKDKYENTSYEYQLGMTSSIKTANTKIASLKKLILELIRCAKDEEINLDINKFHLEPYKKINDAERMYEALEDDEVERLFAFCNNESKYALNKKMYFEIALGTALRKSEILSMKWHNIERKKEDGQYYWVISKLRMKGNCWGEDTVISDEFYQKLSAYRKQITNNTNDDYVIDLDGQTLESVLERFCKEECIPESRKIVLHSLRKTSADMAYATTNDLKLVQEHGHWKSMEMLKRYMGTRRKFRQKASYILTGNKPDTTKLESLSKEQLLEIIGKCSVSAQNEILSKIL